MRKAFVMKLRPGCRREYERRHGSIWPELKAVLKEHGVSSYSIFVHSDSDQLFAYAEIESEARWLEIAQAESCQKWWAHMKDLMLTNDDNSPATINLDEVFHLD